MPEFHAEPYIYLPTVTHKSALIAWGAFYFRVTSRDRFKLVDDSDLKYVHPPRKDSIGACSAPYGPARVEVYDVQGRLVSSAQTMILLGDVAVLLGAAAVATALGLAIFAPSPARP